MFSKRKVITLIMVCLLVLVSVSCCLITNKSESLFNSVKKADLYEYEFSDVSTTDVHSLNLSKGDRLSVSFAIDSGNVDLYIESGATKSYQGNSIKRGSFILDIIEEGVYFIKTDTKKASGKIRIEVLN